MSFCVLVAIELSIFQKLEMRKTERTAPDCLRREIHHEGALEEIYETPLSFKRAMVINRVQNTCPSRLDICNGVG